MNVLAPTSPVVDVQREYAFVVENLAMSYQTARFARLVFYSAFGLKVAPGKATSRAQKRSLVARVVKMHCFVCSSMPRMWPNGVASFAESE